MKRYLLLAALLLMPMLALGQGNTTTLSGSGAPSSGCAFVMRYIDVVGQVEYACDTAGNWFSVGPGAAGATNLNSVTDPISNKAFTMAANTLVWNWSANSSTSNLFSVSDFSSNTGTGYLFTVSTGSSSSTKPVRICYRGTTDCALVINTTTLTTSGAGVIDATKLSGALPAIDGSALTNVNAATLLTKTWASPAAIGTGTPASGTFAGLIGTGAVDFSGSSSSKVRVAAGLTTAANGSIGFDSTGNNLHAYNGADSLVGLLAVSITPTDNDCVKWTVSAGKYTLNTSGAVCGGGGGSGTVTVVGAGSLTNTALVTGGGTTTVQTPSATATMDTSGNISTPGTIAAGVGGSVAGGYEMTQGTANSLGSNAFLIQAPAAISTSFGWTAPAAENGTAGILHVGAASSHLSALTVASVALTELSTQAADTVVSNATGGAAVPTAVAWPTSGTNGCAGSADTLIYNTTTHTLACHQISGSGTVNSGTATHLAYYASSTTAVSDMGADFVFSTHTLSTASTAILDLSAATGTAAFKVPTTTTNTASAAGAITYDSTNSNYHANSGADSLVGIVPTASIPTNGHLIDASVSSSKLLLHDSGVVSANVVNASSPGVGLCHFAGSTQTCTSSAVVGADMTNATVTATQLAAQYSKGSCTEVWGGSGTSFAMTSGDDAIVNNACYNDSGVTRTITAVKCRSDNAANTTTVNPTFGSAGTGTTILSGALTCGNSYAYSSSGTVSNASWTTGSGVDPGMATVGNATSIAVIIEYTF